MVFFSIVYSPSLEETFGPFSFYNAGLENNIVLDKRSVEAVLGLKNV
jgi:hypothetical protein